MKVRCPFCDKSFTGMTKSDLVYFLSTHIYYNHSDECKSDDILQVNKWANEVAFDVIEKEYGSMSGEDEENSDI